MPTGDLVALAVVSVCVVAALLPSRQRQSRPVSIRFWLSYLVNELPFLVGWWLIVVVSVALVDGRQLTGSTIVGLCLAAVAASGLVVIVVRASRTRETLSRAHRLAFGRPPKSTEHRWRRWPRILLWPFPWLIRPGVRRTADITYGPSKFHRLDLYTPRRRPPRGSILVHFHGGAFRMGSKNLDVQPVINRLVNRGWVCVSANYRLDSDVVFPDQLVDVKHLLGWIRDNAAAHGADPDRIVIAGSSAGGHLAATAAFTPNDPRFQPGFETVETSVRAAVCLYPYPGPVESRGPAASPADYVTADAPPVLIASAANDALVAPDESRQFMDLVRGVSKHPVVAAELPGAQHCFDLFHSVRCEAVIDSIVDFADMALGSTRDSSRTESRSTG